jgi:hypothetical protein
VPRTATSATVMPLGPSARFDNTRISPPLTPIRLRNGSRRPSG